MTIDRLSVFIGNTSFERIPDFGLPLDVCGRLAPLTVCNEQNLSLASEVP